MIKDLAEICGFCGSTSPPTRDHIPPKSLFPAPRPNDLITIPSCLVCNQGASESDELFRAYLSLHVGLDTLATRQLWEEALRGVRHNRRLHRSLVANMKKVLLTTPSGMIYGKAHGGPWDSKVHDITIERIIRGLYFHHFREVLGSQVTVECHWYRELSPDLLEATAECQQRSIGGGQFVYRFGRASDGPLHSIWLFEFYQRHWAGGHTTPAQPECECGVDSDSG
jgi:hypothetical protein